MITSIFWIVLRSVAIPFVAVLILKETPLGEDGAVLAVGIAMFIATLISLAWNAFKVVGNTLLLRGNTVVRLITSMGIQIISLIFIWLYYFANFQ
jgi:hypothetical protein